MVRIHSHSLAVPFGLSQFPNLGWLVPLRLDSSTAAVCIAWYCSGLLSRTLLLGESPVRIRAVALAVLVERSGTTSGGEHGCMAQSGRKRLLGMEETEGSNPSTALRSA